MADNPIDPDYYKRFGVYEPRKVIVSWGLGWNLGNACSYIARAGKKDPTKEVEDLLKAIQHINFRIEELGSI